MSISKAKVAMVHLGKIIRISERRIPPMKEAKVRAIMSGVESDVRDWPGLMNMETLIDTEEPDKFMVVTEWESRAHLRHWLRSDLHQRVVDQLNETLDEPVKYRELMHHEDDVFLL
mmetsp:Transcript_21667/g.42557  ORF Transcript_21667/g.42557 Transcript_21667/m.42557 type:complete len:116 (+) Transcript_21667:233-580(+)|eukprot:CAMPEP_0171493002 /NCGR_PEP_ID=MMETSP0958-20121227/4728_1 /TAXON_ID=87120 /ORGANISM="Aurantiochytrium limacinum, Strain ATCCMYA-1381" /LENGTH=115 /DNA_ID=CAMNT_0012026593 /DNA_START=198 /DNA_END=545 /DNA_ORIENTATION=+